jgi:hypothetical protein
MQVSLSDCYKVGYAEKEIGEATCDAEAGGG